MFVLWEWILWCSSNFSQWNLNLVLSVCVRITVLQNERVTDYKLFPEETLAIRIAIRAKKVHTHRTCLQELFKIEMHRLHIICSHIIVVESFYDFLQIWHYLSALWSTDQVCCSFWVFPIQIADLQVFSKILVFRATRWKFLVLACVSGLQAPLDFVTWMCVTGEYT